MEIPTDGVDEGAVLRDFVDYLLPALSPYEITLYLFLLRRSHLNGTGGALRIGKRTIASELGQGVRAGKANYQHVTKMLDSLAEKGCITIGDTTRAGTLYEVRMPMEVPSAREQLVNSREPDPDRDYYADAELRRELFERDGWKCRYCGTTVDDETATLDHIEPRSKGGSNEPSNLATCCLMCNSIKSGRTYEEAAPDILAMLRSRQ